MRVSGAVLAIAVFMASGLAQTSVAPVQQLLGPEDCRFNPPADWRGGAVSWHGQCRAGRAHGNGVLRAYRKGAPPRLYFGDMEHGQLRLGVIEGDEGYLAGRFADGKLVPDTERQEMILAFRSASTAAKAFGERLKREGNARSAAFYLQKSKQLAQQMD